MKASDRKIISRKISEIAKLFYKLGYRDAEASRSRPPNTAGLVAKANLTSQQANKEIQELEEFLGKACA